MTRIYLKPDNLPTEVKCIILDGPLEQFNKHGDSLPCWFLSYGDFWGEALGNSRKFYSYDALQREGKYLAKTYGLELVNDSMPL